MRKFAFVTRSDEKSNVIASYMREKLITGGMEESDHPELVICIGGDGTILSAVHEYLETLNQVQFLGIHTGTLGFLTDYTQNEIEDAIHAILTIQPDVFESRLLEITTKGNVATYYALNEMRIENVIHTQIMDIKIDDELFETCRGTGICLSTQAGSTAYNRSLRGAVIDSGLSVMQLCEITGIQNSIHRSLSVPYLMKENRIVDFYSQTFDEAVLCYDHLYASLKGVTQVTCKMSDKTVRFSRYRPYSYLKRLKNLY